MLAASAEKVDDEHRRHTDDYPVQVHSGPPRHLVVLYDIGAGGASYHPESAAFAVLARPVTAGTSAGTAGHQGGRDDRKSILLIRFAEDPGSP